MSKELDRLTKAVSQLSSDFQRLSRQYLKDAKQLHKRLDKLEKLLKRDSTTIDGHIHHMEEVGRKLMNDEFRKENPQLLDEYEAWLGAMHESE